MIENSIKAATCAITCGSQLGTGQLVHAATVLTARHCIIDAIESEQLISLLFSVDGNNLEVGATLLADSPDLDVCLLRLAEGVNVRPIPLSSALPTEGHKWMSFGYPNTKMGLSHRLSGTISQVLQALTLKIDLDLAVEGSASLDAYDGMSGAGIICDGVCKGVVRLNVDRSIAGISVARMRDFLSANQVPFLADDTQHPGAAPKETLAGRADFDQKFDALLAAAAGTYVFLEGAHGIGKTTFCSSYEPSTSGLLALGAYSLAAGGANLGPAQRAQPEVVVSWLATVVSELLTGRSSRQEDMTYAQLIELCSQLLAEFSRYCVEKGRQGVLFFDGLNEAQAISDETLTKLIGLLPLKLPDSVTIVLTAPNFDTVSSALNGRVKREAKISLPALTDDAAREYCLRHPELGDAPAALISKICSKAKGHPLYLRYVIEYVVGRGGEMDLDNFPEFSGIVEDYYEVLWSHLQADAEAVSLLAIIARLRSSIPLAELTPILTQPELRSFVGVIGRIRHLLLRHEETGVYHPSFAHFLIAKTEHINIGTHGRLADFCKQEANVKYCTINLAFHLMRSTEAHRKLAVALCTQPWVDRCVTLGAEADSMLYDIDEVVGAAVMSAPAAEVIRLLLLSQRVKFRYNVLFAQSAGQIAEALIALNRPDDALNHLVRFDTPLCQDRCRIT